jgi:hypothetical protein
MTAGDYFYPKVRRDACPKRPNLQKSAADCGDTYLGHPQELTKYSRHMRMAGKSAKGGAKHFSHGGLTFQHLGDEGAVRGLDPPTLWTKMSRLLEQIVPDFA